MTIRILLNVKIIIIIIPIIMFGFPTDLNIYK